MLAIVTPDPDSPAETFIRQHIFKLAPGRTSVVFFRGDGVSLKGIPALKARNKGSQTAGSSRLAQAANLIMHGYSGAISGRSAVELAEFLKSHQVRRVLAEFGTSGAAVAPVCRRLGIPLHVYFHGYDATVLPARWDIRLAYRLLGRRVERIYCASDYFRRILLGLGFDPERIHVVSYGIEVEEFHPQPQSARDSNLILAVGRLVDKKAPQLTIQAFAEVLSECPQARLEIVGDGPLFGECIALIERLGLRGRVVLHGARDHEFVKKKFSEASLFVQHSVTAPNGDTESLGVSLLEAMASGIPVVATRHNGFVETVSEGQTGYLVEEGDVAAMAARITALMQDPDLRHSLGTLGRIRVEARYSSNLQIERLRSLLLDP